MSQSSNKLQIAGINEAVVREFRKVWSVSGGGVGEIEGAVLLYRMADGAISARSLGMTNQRMKFSMVCDGNVMAIVHNPPEQVYRPA